MPISQANDNKSDAHTVAQAQHHNKAVGHQIAHHRNQPCQKSEQNQRISHRQRPPHQRQNHQQINRGQRGVDGGDADLRKKHIGKAAQQFIKAPRNICAKGRAPAGGTAQPATRQCRR